MRDFSIIIAVGLLIFFFIIALCYLIWGDISNKDGFQPLLVILPTMAAVLGYLIYKTNSK